MTRDVDQLLAPLKRANPVYADDLLDSSESEFARALFEQVVASQPEASGSTGPGVESTRRGLRGRRESLPRLRVAFGVALATGLAGAVLAAVALNPNGNSALAPDEAAAALDAAAAASVEQVADPLKPGEYYYVRTRGIDIGSGVRETWIGYDGSLVIRDGVSGKVMFRGRERYSLGSRGPVLSYEELLALPKEPAKLSVMVRDAVQPSVPGDDRQPINQQMIVNMRESLYARPIPPDLRAAFYNVASEVPAIEVYPDVELPDGRTGTAMGVSRGSDDGLREEIIFDPQTGDMIALADFWEGEREVLSLITETGVVSDLGQRP